MDDESFIHWVEDRHTTPGEVASEEVICGLDNPHSGTYTSTLQDNMIAVTDQIAAENLMYLSQDVVYTETPELEDDRNVECVTEEVITDDWVIPDGQERVEVPFEHLNTDLELKEVNDVDVPLPTDQDEYTAMRPWPCDFCSRRFRKKAALMNHMVAHQNDRPHACNLCGVRYVRKCDLMSHLKVHAFVPDNSDSIDYNELYESRQVVKQKKKRGRRKKIPDPEENGRVEHMTSARTQQWSRRTRPSAPARSPPSPASASPSLSRSPSPSPSPSLTSRSVPEPPSPPPPADPRKPFVCSHCGIGFAREKALQSHSRIHGGDSPLECGACGELCWSREALAAHARLRHPLLPAAAPLPDYDSCSGDEYRASASASASPASSRGSGDRDRARQRPGGRDRCAECGVAFQRADLLRRHVAAAHRYAPRRPPLHACDVCGEACADALQLLAHAEGHARAAPSAPSAPSSRPRRARGRHGHASAASARQFPCRECGKVFGSRSSQQIHIRIHTGERPYACRFCWKAFADGGTLRKHERIHTGEKPYACAVCPRAFNQRVVLREHVRSHHSAPDYRRANGGPAYLCVVCGRSLHSSAELVQHLIQHCDANTALKRQPQGGPRKYKRRRKLKSERRESWEMEVDTAEQADVAEADEWPPPPAASATPPPPAPPSPPAPSPPAAAPASPPAPSPRPRLRRRRAPPPPRPRPRMIHTEDPRAKNKLTRSRRPPRRPADDLRAIQQPLGAPAASPTPSLDIKEEPVEECLVQEEEAEEAEEAEEDAGGPHVCEICNLKFERRSALLLHVPIHIYMTGGS